MEDVQLCKPYFRFAACQLMRIVVEILEYPDRYHELSILNDEHGESYAEPEPELGELQN